MDRNIKIILITAGVITAGVLGYFGVRYLIKEEKKAKRRAERIKILKNFPIASLKVYGDFSSSEPAWQPSNTSSFDAVYHSVEGDNLEKNIESYKKYGDDTVVVSYALQNYNTGGYKWQGGGSGMPIDIKFKSPSPLFRKPPNNTTYCTGYTFAVFFITALNRGLLKNFTDADIKKLQRIWNQGDGTKNPKLCVNAISKSIGTNKPLGKEVSLDEAEAGDFCQIWRTSGSGHAVVLLEKIVDERGIVGISYYSSNNGAVNKETGRNGAGASKEYFSDTKVGGRGAMLRSATYFARLND